jgi:hypothetical protein
VLLIIYGICEIRNQQIIILLALNDVNHLLIIQNYILLHTLIFLNIIYIYLLSHSLLRFYLFLFLAFHFICGLGEDFPAFSLFPDKLHNIVLFYETFPRFFFLEYSQYNSKTFMWGIQIAHKFPRSQTSALFPCPLRNGKKIIWIKIYYKTNILTRHRHANTFFTQSLRSYRFSYSKLIYAYILFLFLFFSSCLIKL